MAILRRLFGGKRSGKDKDGSKIDHRTKKCDERRKIKVGSQRGAWFVRDRNA